MEIEVIAHAENGFEDKFGIPRQPSVLSGIETRIVFEPDYRNPDAIRCIEGFSHLWLIWGFSESASLTDRFADRTQTASLTEKRPSWHATVRPPRLGGNVRVGVFASRSPYRPNPLGISSVRLLRIEQQKDGSKVLVVSGADLLNGTPIYDIKPYLRYSDSHPEAQDGFAETEWKQLEVQWPNNPENRNVPARILTELKEILAQDPRPAYQNDPQRVYKLDYSGFTVSFCVKEDALFVLNIVKNDKK
ncbi:MAG: tRNA (N6-threonylcarbamoyladenosine(37)-N6)-methyltransferase TrmO [Paludibacteraceae bacterium]|nr:tRNA (N6-threonylcarbamoyladenosine(37)-N6)-methyltransferase TrmO [Paludibacteraceae bacterium]